MPELLEMTLGEHVWRGLWATSRDDPVEPMLVNFFGADDFTWASDFPRTDSTRRHSLDVIERDFQQVPEKAKQKIICEDAAQLYWIDLN